MKHILIALALLSTLAAAAIDPADARSRSHHSSSRSYSSSGFHGHLGYYRTREGHLVPRPNNDPRGATALCNNGRYSHSEHPSASGTCSYNGGVSAYIGSGGGTNAGSSVTTRTQPFKPGPGDPTEKPLPMTIRERPL